MHLSSNIFHLHGGLIHLKTNPKDKTECSRFARKVMYSNFEKNKIKFIIPKHYLSAPCIHVGVKSGAGSLCGGQRVKRSSILTYSLAQTFAPILKSFNSCDVTMSWFWVNWLSKWFWKVLRFAYCFTCTPRTFDSCSHTRNSQRLNGLSLTLLRHSTIALLRHSTLAPTQCVMLLSNVGGGVVKKSKFFFIV
jgi:hypothetical protein